MKFVIGSEWVSNSRRRRCGDIKMYRVSDTLSKSSDDVFGILCRVFHNIIMQASYHTLWISITNLRLGGKLRYRSQKLVGIINLAEADSKQYLLNGIARKNKNIITV